MPLQQARTPEERQAFRFQELRRDRRDWLNTLQADVDFCSVPMSPDTYTDLDGNGVVGDEQSVLSAWGWLFHADELVRRVGPEAGTLTCATRARVTLTVTLVCTQGHEARQHSGPLRHGGGFPAPPGPGHMGKGARQQECLSPGQANPSPSPGLSSDPGPEPLALAP